MCSDPERSEGEESMGEAPGLNMDSSPTRIIRLRQQVAKSHLSTQRIIRLRQQVAKSHLSAYDLRMTHRPNAAKISLLVFIAEAQSQREAP
mgnify:CR=1 FL=1